jgi:hypothetical protein
MSFPTNFSPVQLIIQYGTGNINVTVNLLAYAINVNVTPSASFASGLVGGILQNGYWNGLTFIPAGQITLITAS